MSYTFKSMHELANLTVPVYGTVATTTPLVKNRTVGLVYRLV